MNLETLKNVGGLKVQRAIFKARKYAPEILTGVGIVSGVASTVVIAKQTLKLENILDEFHARVEFVKGSKDQYPSETAYNKELAYVYGKFALDLTKLYGPGVSLALGSIAAILGAHGIMKRRQVAILAAYQTVQTAFQEYRKRVLEEFGDEKDIELLSGIRTEKIKNEETGKTKTVKSQDPNAHSGYAKFFDEFNPNWKKNGEYNSAFLRNTQNYMNDLLRLRGHVFLNEVYDALDIERTSAGAAVGWVLSEEGGDNYIDFGIFNPNSDQARRFVNGIESAVLLDFNVDGVIIDKI